MEASGAAEADGDLLRVEELSRKKLAQCSPEWFVVYQAVQEVMRV